MIFISLLMIHILDVLYVWAESSIWAETDTWLFIYAWKVYNVLSSMIILLRLMAPDLTLY